MEARASGSTALLPDLVADPPDGMELVTDTSTKTARMLLRFNGYIHNKGPGALDFRGTRVAPQLSKEVEEAVKKAEEKKAVLPQPIEEELAASPMKATQRVFTTAAGEEETNIERAHVEEPSSAELIYSSADGHYHWHLQHAAKYSLWNATKTAEVAPAQKVGFCLDDSQHVELGKGPTSPVYADNVPPFRDFCQQFRPNATSLFEGISPGWRDLYDKGLAFQWVDVSSVLPGEYWLRSDVNPSGIVKETGGPNVPAYAASATIIPGFDALAQSSSTGFGEAKTITLSARAWNDTATPAYKIVAQPAHGKLSAISSGKVTYTPNAGYSGSDSFTFSAADPNSQFPTSPAVATVSLQVAAAEEPPEEAEVAIEGAPASLIAGTSVQLSAHVSNDSLTVTWAASAGTITQAGLYTAPAEVPSGGTVTVSATTSKGAKDQRTIAIVAAAPSEPAPELPPETSPETPVGTPPETPVGNAPGGGTNAPNAPEAPTTQNAPSMIVTGVSPSSPIIPSGGTLGVHTVSPPRLAGRPTAVLFGRMLVMSARAATPGSIRLSAFLGGRRFATCVVSTPADRTLDCRVRLPQDIALGARIRVQASLRDGAKVARSVREAAPVEQMKMGAVGAHSATAASFWCTPAAVSKPR
ncbi:MAG TPA: lysyl oxidase family protein [Solirubrobacteraceae bacterium]|jgi:hypothetical protein